MINTLKMLSFLLLTMSFALHADLNDDLNDDAWDRIFESQSNSGGGYVSAPEYYWGSVFGNKETGKIGFSYGGALPDSIKQGASEVCEKENGSCQEIVFWESACMTIIWSPSKKQFFHSIDTQLEDEAIISALDACKASGATDCTFKGELGEQAMCTYAGYVKHERPYYRSIYGNFDSGWVWLSYVAPSAQDARKDAAENCNREYGNCKLITSIDSQSGCIGLAWSASQKQFFSSNPIVNYDASVIVSKAIKTCEAAGATDCKGPNDPICAY